MAENNPTATEPVAEENNTTNDSVNASDQASTDTKPSLTSDYVKLLEHGLGVQVATAMDKLFQEGTKCLIDESLVAMLLTL